MSNEMNNAEDALSFKAVKERLDAIVEIVSDDSLPLEEALKYYEEAVTLGLKASDLLEQGIDANTAQYDFNLDQEETASKEYSNNPSNESLGLSE